MNENTHNRHKWWALLGMSLLAFTAYLDATIVNTALPFIRTALKVSIAQLQWVSNIFTIILSMTMIAFGKCADMWGRKKVFYIGVIIFAIASLGAGFSVNLGQLVFFRALQAIGASTIFVISAALISDVFPENERVKAISIFGGMTGFGLMIGPFLGGILVQFLGWRWVFWVNLPLIIVGFGACSFSLKSSSKSHKVKMDWLGLILLMLGLGCLMYGITEGSQQHWRSTTAWIVFAVGFIALTVLIIMDTQRKEPLLDLHIFREKIIVLSALSCALAGVASTVFMFFDPLYLRIVRHLSPFYIGLLVATIPAVQALISLVFNRSVKAFGVANLLLVSVLAAFCASGLHLLIKAETPLLFLILPFFLLGINWGLSNSAAITAVNQVVASHEIAAAVGTIATIWNFVGSVLLAASTAIFDAAEKRSSFLPAFHNVMLSLMILASIVLVYAITIYSRLNKTNIRI